MHNESTERPSRASALRLAIGDGESGFGRGIDGHILAHVADAVIFLDREWRYLYANESARHLHEALGVEYDSVSGRRIESVFPELVGSTWERTAREAVRSQRAIERVASLPAMGVQLELRFIPTGEGLAVFARDVTQRERTARGGQLLAEAGRVLAAHLDVDETLQSLAALLVAELADWCYVDVREAQSFRRLAVAHADPSLGTLARRLRRSYDDVSGARCGPSHAVRTRRAQLLDDISDEELAEDTQDEEHLSTMRAIGPIRSCVCVPLVARDRAIGALTLLQTASGRRFREEDLPLLEELGRRVALAVDNAELYAAERRARRAAEQAVDRISRLQELTASLSSTLTAQEVADVVVDEGVSALGAKAGSVALVDADGTLRVLRAIGYDADVLAQFDRFSIDAPLPLAEAVRTGEPVIQRTSGEREARYPHLAGARRRIGGGALAALPLIVDGRSIGAIGLNFAEERPLVEGDAAFLLALAHQSAQAFERARLREAESNARADAEAANRTKTDFLAAMSHELRTPLNAIRGYAQLLEMGVRGPVTPEQVHDLQRIRRSEEHLLSIINDILNMARLEAGTVHYHVDRVPLRELLDEVEMLLAPQMRAKGLHYESRCAGDDVAASADADRMRQIVLNLLSNAAKFTPAGGSIVTSCDGDDAMIRIRVSDTGHGIPPERLDDIFEPFVQIHRTLRQPAEGAGLGLAISRRLARAMGGELDIESASAKGSVFVLTLPRA